MMSWEAIAGFSAIAVTLVIATNGCWLYVIGEIKGMRASMRSYDKDVRECKEDRGNLWNHIDGHETRVTRTEAVCEERHHGQAAET